LTPFPSEKELGAHRAHGSPGAHPLVVPRDWLGRTAGPARPRPRSWSRGSFYAGQRSARDLLQRSMPPNRLAPVP
jgi:hypothetical protein